MKRSLLFPVEVACAILFREGKILITRRRKGNHLGGLWEFPGGKRLSAESLGTCLKRELFEELGIRVGSVRFLKRIDYRYPEKQVSLYFCHCELVEGKPWLRGCEAFLWVWPFQLRRYPFPPADEAILRSLEAYHK